jgi:hypothetical protein
MNQPQAAGSHLSGSSAPTADRNWPDGSRSVDQAQSTSDDNTQVYSATLELSPTWARIDDPIQVSGTGYPPDAAVELIWHTVEGRYEIEDGTEFVGERFDPYTQTVGTTRADRDGKIATTFVVPVSFGGMHDVRATVQGREVSQAGLTVHPTLSLTPEKGPIGTSIELRIAGVDQQINLNTWHLLYDNRYLGFASAVTTDGVAVARFRAAGPVGKHYIAAWNNSYNSAPYLAWATGPFRDIPGPGTVFTFEVTEDQGPAEPLIEDYSRMDHPWPQNRTGPARLTLTVDRGPVGQPTTLSGRDLPRNTSIQLLWSTTVGDRVSGVGQTHLTRSLGDVETGPTGTFTTNLLIPDDLGGQHRIEAKVGDRLLGSVGLVIIPSIVSIGPRRVHQGEEIFFHLKGVGWTTFENTYAVTYDNGFIGYGCGFSTHGDVQFKLTATGSPGTHIIDLYPTIFKGKDEIPKIYSLPQLTYAEDHPSRITPAIRTSFEIVE